MAVILEGGCRVSRMREGEPRINGTLRIWTQVGRATGAQAISLRVMEFAPGVSPGIRNDEVDQILYLIGQWYAGVASDGQGGTPPMDQLSANNSHPEGVHKNDAFRLFIGGDSYDVQSDTGIYIRPGETFAIDNPGPDPIILIGSQCPDPDRAPTFAESITSLPANSSLTERRLVRLADRPAQTTADRWYCVMVDEEVGSSLVTQFVGSIPPGRAPDHFHNYEEVLFILRGQGRMWAGETKTPIAPGSCIYLPKGQVHCVENTGTGALRLLGVFYPAGNPSVRYDVPR